MAMLSANDLEILKVLWEEGPLKPAEIQQRLSRPVKNSALRWQLGTLMKSGHVSRSKKGKAYYYRARTPRQRVLRNLMHRLADVFSGGSAVALLGQLIESQPQWSDEDLRALHRIAAGKTPAGGQSESSSRHSSGGRGGLK
jgi:BlaI family penicillinase repressor